MGRKKKIDNTRYKNRYPDKIYKRWMPYEAAKLTIREYMKEYGEITSRGTYWKWHDEVRPYYIPKMAHRVYKEEWVSWNEFLGVDNSWDGWDRKAAMTTRWMPYWEAVRYVQKLGLKDKQEYREAKRDGRIPDNIPLGPDNLILYKDDWQGWPSFLGKNLVSKVESAEKVVGVIAVCISNILSSNVLEFIIAPEGRGQLQDRVDGRKDLRIGKMYVWDAREWMELKGWLMKVGYEQGENVFMFPNVNEVIYEMDSRLMIYR